MKRARKILVSAILTSIGISLAEIEDSPKPRTQEDADKWVQGMNKFMPLVDEVVLIGIKGAFKEVKMLQNYGRQPERVKPLELSKEDKAILRDIRRHADWAADTHPYPHILIVDIFYATQGIVPILPDCQQVALLSVSSKNGETDIVNVVDGSFTGCDMGKNPFMEAATQNRDFNFFAYGRVLGHAWPN